MIFKLLFGSRNLVFQMRLRQEIDGPQAEQLECPLWIDTPR